MAPTPGSVIFRWKYNYPGEATHHFAGAGTSPSNDEPQFIREAAPIFATTAVADAAAVAVAAVGTGAAAAVATPVAVAAVAFAGIAMILRCQGGPAQYELIPLGLRMGPLWGA